MWGVRLPHEPQMNISESAGQRVPDHILIGMVINAQRSKTLLFKRTEQKLFPGIYAPIGAGPYPNSTDFRSKMIEELHAEAGVDGKIVVMAPVFLMRIATKLQHMHVFFIEVDEQSSIVLNDEHTKYAWVNFEELQHEPYDPRLYPQIQKLMMLEKLQKFIPQKVLFWLYNQILIPKSIS